MLHIQVLKKADSTYRIRMSYSFHYTAADTDLHHPANVFRQQILSGVQETAVRITEG